MKKTPQRAVAIQLSEINKTYSLFHEKPTLVGSLINKRRDTFQALKNINLTILQGERVGIIGSNGSGKTTLLKIIAGIAFPDNGSVFSHGKVVSMIGLDAGFHPELSGIDNIYLNGMLLGMTKKQIRSRLTAIIHFAQLGKFIDIPIHTYSQGMIARLGFAIAIHSHPDILLIDECIEVGDRVFREKIIKQLSKLFGKTTFVVISHNMFSLADLCDRIIVINEGAISADGGTDTLWSYDQKNAPELKKYMKRRKKL